MNVAEVSKKPSSGGVVGVTAPEIAGDPAAGLMFGLPSANGATSIGSIAVVTFGAGGHPIPGDDAVVVVIAVRPELANAITDHAVAVDDAARDRQRRSAALVGDLAERLAVVDVDGRLLESVHDEVADRGGRPLTQQNAGVALAALLGVGIAQQREVVERRIRARRQGSIVPIVVRFDTLVGIVAALQGHHELPLAAPAVRPVEAVVGDPVADHVTYLDGAAEELHTVVLVERDLDVLDLGAAAHALERNPVQLVVGAELGAGELDARVAEVAAVVVGVAAAVYARVTFTHGRPARHVERCVAVDDQAAPIRPGPALQPAGRC